MAKDNKPAAKKKHWWNTIADAYRITKRSYVWLPWGMLGSAVLGLGIGFLLAFLTKQWLGWIILGGVLAGTLPLLLLVQLVKSASYRQLDGMTGASSAVLDSLGRGWDVKEEPVRFNARTQDMVFRAIGRPGVVLVTEGPKNRVRKLADDERKAIRRVAPHAPVHVIMVGHDTGQVTLAKLEKTIRHLPKAISNQEVAALSRRLEAINSNNLPIPKGIDPYNVRLNRRALRGK